VFNLQTKFEMSSFIRSRDMAWAPKCRNESCDPDNAHLGDVTDMSSCMGRSAHGVLDDLGRRRAWSVLEPSQLSMCTE